MPTLVTVTKFRGKDGISFFKKRRDLVTEITPSRALSIGVISYCMTIKGTNNDTALSAYLGVVPMVTESHFLVTPQPSRQTNVAKVICDKLS